MHSHAQPVAWPRTAMPPNSSMALAGHTPKQFHGPNGPQTQAGPWPMRNHATTVVWPAMHPPANTPPTTPLHSTTQNRHQATERKQNNANSNIVVVLPGLLQTTVVTVLKNDRSVVCKGQGVCVRGGAHKIACPQHAPAQCPPHRDWQTMPQAGPINLASVEVWEAGAGGVQVTT